MRIAGIDPGVTGALLILDPEKGWIVHDAPVIKSGGTSKYVLPEMVRLLEEYQLDLVVLEEIGAWGKGVKSIASLNRGFAYWHGLCVALKIPIMLVKPDIWKKEILKGRLPDKSFSDKDAIRLCAMELFPTLAPRLMAKKDHDRAEAAFLVQYGMLKGTR